MASHRENFNHSGPLYLTAVDWRNTHHRRSIAASLVQGVYILERDRQENRQGRQALAPPWWEFFNFHLIHVLVDDQDLSFFGAIYEFKYHHHHHFSKCIGQNPPKFIVAFRGTITKPDTRSQDLKLDLQLMRNKLRDSSRFRQGLQAVQDIAAKAGPGNVWLAGHSLGSAIGLLIGRNMVKMGLFLETYLFNPPFTSVPIEKLKNDKLKDGIRFASSVITAGLAVAVGSYGKKHKDEDPFKVLSGWLPYMFVNPSDPICSEYVGYFENRGKMIAAGAGKIGRIATQHSLGNLMLGKICEPLHLLPSAYLTVHSSPSQDLKQAHGIHQWWRPDLHCQHKLYQF